MIYSVLQSTGLPVAYSHFKHPVDPPYLIYLGGGQDQFLADNEIYKKQNTYQVEYYFNKKEEAVETSIEEVLEQNGFFYSKSEDAYISDQKMFVIYYDVWKKGFYNG